MRKYVLLHEHRFGFDCFLFEFQPSKNRSFPSELALADHFGLDFEPDKNERLTVVSINNVDSVPRFTADQIGTRNPCDSSSQDEAYEAFTGSSGEQLKWEHHI